MEKNRKIAAGSVLTIAMLILSAAAYIVYRTNIAGAGYFQNATVPLASKLTLTAMLIIALALVAGQFELDGIAGIILNIVTGILRIAAPAVCIAAMMYLLNGRIEGFAFIYMSNEEVLHEVQTAANLASAHSAIANIVLLGVSAIVGIVGAFFSMKKCK